MVLKKSAARFAASVLGRTIIGVLTLSVLLSSGCESKSSSSNTPANASPTTAASEKGATNTEAGFDYLKARREFAEADFFKPAAESADEDTIRMAPLIVREVAGDEAGQWRLGVDLARLQGDESATADPRVVYFHRDVVVIGGWEHNRLSYVWILQNRESGELQWCGVRMVRGVDGRSVLSEVVASDATKREVFVAQTVEDRSWIEFGKPFAGRRYAVEASLEDAPDTFVTRVISDGPEPMGPFVYLEANGRDVTTLLCRCMPSQYEGVRKNAYYDLRSLNELDADMWGAKVPKLADCLNGIGDALPLATVLRIPNLHANNE